MLFHMAQCVSVYWDLTIVLQEANAFSGGNEEDRARDGPGLRVESEGMRLWLCATGTVETLRRVGL